ncbi:XRE family transcriptional regulator [Hymenobacter gummosus]|uniref:XRE family transcriptional regulator n=1 Tax=Hymenobacter gummosus TaxID=1776032 RepID=A0A431U9P5_9BACT|nr:helix-turn-helix transcriptional regulator [Hymenobacter gummosus]RTQ53572.1 XRE family transcriptional regulator [Hymenobacter gummosus]
MTRIARPSLAFSAQLRTRLGLTREELGLLLGVTAAQVSHVENGRRGYSARAQERLYRLAALLPAAAAPAGAAAPPAPPAGPSPAEAAALRKRLRGCRRRLYHLRYDEAAPAARAAQLERRHLTLARLAEALAQPPAAAPPADAGRPPEREQEWLALLELGTRRLAHRQPTPTALAWRALKAQLLEAEIRGLEQLLGEAPAPPNPAGE